MNRPHICDTLGRLFNAIISEAERNPRLAERLAEVIGEPVAAYPKSQKRPGSKAFDASQFHAINILRMHGEAALRGKLEQVRTVENLRAVARASGLVLAGSAGGERPSRAEMILGIVEAAKHYDAQRSAATG